MTGKERHHEHDDERLTQLYREQGDIEPGPGVDQRIRARARDGVGPFTLPRPASWLGGVAAAASLAVVVSIVVDMEPPGSDTPQGGLEQLRRSVPPATDADRARSSAFSETETETAGRGADADPVMEQVTPSPAESAPAPLMEPRARDSAEGEAAGNSRQLHESLGGLRQTEDIRAQPRELPRAMKEAELEALDQRPLGAERALRLIEGLIAAGRAEKARVRVEAFRNKYPEDEIPRSLIDRLEALEAVHPQD